MPEDESSRRDQTVEEMAPARGEISSSLTGPIKTRSIAITGLFLLAIFYTLYFARAVLMPITAAFVLFLMFSPIVRFLARFKMPQPAGAGIVVASVFMLFAAGIYFVADPASKWVSDMPHIVDRIQTKLQKPVKEIQEVQENVERAVGLASGAPEPAKQPQSGQPVLALTSVIVGGVASALQAAGWTLLVIFVLLYFLLASGDMFRDKLVVSLPRLSDKKRAVAITRQIERTVSEYLLTITVINAGLGISYGLALFFIGMPNAALWGVLIAVLNFLPFLGTLLGVPIMAVVGLISFESLWESLLPAAIYMGLHFVEANFITPALLSRRLTLNPVVVFLALVFWGWLWGAPGALLAVPLLASLKVIGDSIERLAPLGEFLGGRQA